MESIEEEIVPNSVQINENQNAFKAKQTNAFVMDKKQPLSTELATTYLYNVYRVLGLYVPPQQHKVPYIIYSIVLNGLVTIFLPFAFTYSYKDITAENLQVSHLLTSVQVVSDVYSVSAKVIIMAFMLTKLRSTNAVLAKLDARARDPDEVAELHEIVRIGRKIVVFYGIAYFCYSSSTCITSVLSGVPPYSIFLFNIHWRNSRHEFVLASFIEYILMDFACLQQLATDSYGVIFVCILRGHLNILLMRIRKLGTNKAMTLDENYEELKACIRDHQHLLELFNIIAPIVSKTIFVQFIVTAVILGIALLNILIFTTEFSVQVASCIFVACVLLEIAPLCYVSQLLVDDSTRLSNEIFHSHWIDQDVRYRKMLIFFMHRAQQPMELTAGKLFPITLSTLLGIVKFSFTLYTFITEMGIKERFNLE